MSSTGRDLRRAQRLLAFTAALVATGPGAAQPLDPPRAYLVSGEGAMTLRGPHCCGDSRFTGRFEAAYGIDGSGQVTLNRVSVQLDDLDVVVDAFLGLWTERITFRCTSAGSRAPALGFHDGSGGLSFPAGALTIDGVSHEERLPDGTCAAEGVAFEATNNAAVTAVHDPLADVFGLNAAFLTTLDGESYELGLRLDGHFLNRPPEARLGLLTPQSLQPGCPAYWRWDESQAWELVAEANSPGGLKATPVSSSVDPDGAWASGDVLAERWFLSRDSGPRVLLGDGRYLAPAVFEFGPVHRLELLAADQSGALDADVCQFRVVDGLPPEVTAPPPLLVACSEPGGATPGGSPPLAAFLGSASATDLVDPAPLRLTTMSAGMPVLDSSFFPQDGLAHEVTFWFRDAWGNTGSSASSVTVVDGGAPSVAVGLSPLTLPATGKWWVISASLSASDDCGAPVALQLASIHSNAPAYDAADILDAAYGSDDRSFVLRGRLAAPGVPRVYEVTYQGRDAAGNAALVTATVKVSQ